MDLILMIGTTLGHYRIVEKLGAGGMGVVYKAQDLHLDRFVALKVLPPEKVADAERKRRFTLEAESMLMKAGDVTIGSTCVRNYISNVIMHCIITS